MSSEENLEPSPTSGTKGRPTPTRREAEAALRKPLVPDDRKLAKQIAKQKRAEAYERERIALETGDERYLPVRDKGRIRRYIRNYVDARWSVAEFLLPAMLIFLGGMLLFSFLPMLGATGNFIIVGLTVLFYGMLVISLIESFFVWRKIKKRVAEKYPGEQIPRGSWFYLYSRMLMARRWRSPKPMVARGEFPK
ncbi:DUF3043 domain-containing protein [Actinomyces minihominis]|uniref:DUF3043 domain-containing protein n=1 Tax=Actinomyces minihominis TaxID=2002838 RepID=UPI000C07A8C1|nr:DUF3043 domain-containing protein [Actinomyces minihominis]